MLSLCNVCFIAFFYYFVNGNVMLVFYVNVLFAICHFYVSAINVMVKLILMEVIMVMVRVILVKMLMFRLMIALIVT